MHKIEAQRFISNMSAAGSKPYDATKLAIKNVIAKRKQEKVCSEQHIVSLREKRRISTREKTYLSQRKDLSLTEKRLIATREMNNTDDTDIQMIQMKS